MKTTGSTITEQITIQPLVPTTHEPDGPTLNGEFFLNPAIGAKREDALASCISMLLEPKSVIDVYPKSGEIYEHLGRGKTRLKATFTTCRSEEG